MRIDRSAKGFAWLSVSVLSAVALLGVLFLWSGIYSVAASRGHWAVTEWLLTFAMRNSVKTHALGVDTPPLDRGDLITLGAAHFHSGCAYCHGGPGLPISPVALAMLPPPPDLATQMRPWRDRELFWIVKNGIKYTGMPGWAAQQRDDEVWAVVAFLRRLPSLDARAYRDLAMGQVEVEPQSGQDVATSETASAAVGACARCHGAGQDAPPSALAPVLHGQPAEFLIAALEDYARGRRASGMMQPIASDLTSQERERVARYYAALRPLSPRSDPGVDTVAIERGRAIAERGNVGANIPACAGCHGNTSLSIYPRLAAQNQPYLANRLQLWKRGLVARTETEIIMAPIARALSEQQINDVTAYYASAASAP